jgi:hypothetical protein
MSAVARGGPEAARYLRARAGGLPLSCLEPPRAPPRGHFQAERAAAVLAPGARMRAHTFQSGVGHGGAAVGRERGGWQKCVLQRLYYNGGSKGVFVAYEPVAVHANCRWASAKFDILVGKGSILICV